MKMCEFIEDVYNDQIIKVMYKGEFLLDGKAGDLAVLLGHKIKENSVKVLDNGKLQIGMEVI